MIWFFLVGRGQVVFFVVVGFWDFFQVENKANDSAYLSIPQTDTMSCINQPTFGLVFKMWESTLS